MEGLRLCDKPNQLLLTLSFKILCFIFPLYFVRLFFPFGSEFGSGFWVRIGIASSVSVDLDPYSNYRENEEKEVKRIMSAKDLF
jgi:hypothetical protein